MKNNKMRNKCLLASLALLLSSCATVNRGLNANLRLLLEGDEPDPTTQSFVLEDTISFEDPYANMTIQEINRDVVESVRKDREEKNKQRAADKAAFQENVIRALSGAASIGSALYTKNYSSISPDTMKDTAGSVMLMLGIDSGSSVLSMNTKILNALQNIQNKLNEISDQITEMEINLVDHINNLSQNLQTATNEILNAIADAEVRTRFSNSLTFFQAAKSNWDHFVTSQYVPLQNMCNDFLATYTKFFGEFLDECYLQNGMNVTVYYSESGHVTLPRGKIDIDINGERIARYKNILVPLAEKTFAKVNSLGGSAYNLIDLDILADLLDQGMDKEDAKDVIKQLRLNASKSYFSDFDSIQSFFNAYINFGEALTGLTLDGVDASNMSPVGVYRSLLSSVYNFGFETEEEITALIAKMARVYYSASYINDMARMFSPTNLYEDRFNLIEDQIVKGLSVEGRVKSNIGRKFYSYDIDSYVEFEEHSLELQSEFYAGKRDEYDDDKYCQDFNNPEYKQTEKGTHIYLDGNEIDLSAIGQKSVAYADFEMMKIKFIHNIQPGLSTPVSFGTYLMQNGIINDPTKNIVFNLSNIFGGDEPQDVHSDPYFNLYLTGEYQHEKCGDAPGVQFSQLDRKQLNDTAKVVVSGRCATFDTDLGECGQYVLGVGFIYYDQDDDTYRLDAFSSHPEKYYEDNDMGAFINIHAINKDDKPVDYKNGALGFVLSDITDCYILAKTSIE